MTDRAASPRRRGARSAARLSAVQALYQAESTGESADQIIGEFLEHRLDREGENEGPVDVDLFTDVVRGTCGRGAEIDDLLSAHLAAGWPLERLDRTLKVLLRAATYELVARADIPAAVILDEYMEVAHAFFGGDEPGFANGVLDQVNHAVRGRPAKTRGPAR